MASKPAPAPHPRRPLVHLHPHDIFHNERIWALSIIYFCAWYVRAWDPLYSTAYMDESVYVVYGRMFLSRVFESPLDTPLHHSFGWYLWPAMAAIADRVGGLAGVRELAALMGLLCVVSMYYFARKLYSPEVGVASAAIYALLAPAVYASRIATRDAGALGFFALGMWLYALAWEKRKTAPWLGSAAAFFAAFLCKYLVAVFFPALVLIAIFRRRESILRFAAPLTAASAIYLAVYFEQLRYLVKYGMGYSSLLAKHEVLDIYLWRRADFWLIAGLSLFGFLWKKKKLLGGALWLGATLLLGFQAIVRSDYDYWKHAAYALFFLTPLAAAGTFEIVRRVHGKRGALGRVAWTAVVTVAIAVTCGWLGDSWHMDRFLFWPNVDPALAWLDSKMVNNERVLVDDSVFRYYLHPTLRQWQIGDPFFFHYGDKRGIPAYQSAVHEGAFEYIILDGGLGEEAREMDAAISPLLSERYQLQLTMPDTIRRQRIEIYSRRDPAPALQPASKYQVAITSPASNDMVTNPALKLTGTTTGAPPPEWKVRAQVFTDRWYYQGETVLMRDGSYKLDIYLGGEGQQQCYHLVRAELIDEQGKPQATATLFGVARANRDGSRPACAAPLITSLR
jgi:hypothetical protein